VKSPLTDREWEVLDLLCDGATTREIAEALYLSPETVNSHAKSVLKKLGVHSRAAAVEAASVLRGEVLV
jgi:DNA-binding NarL/FixJ family response regulator